MVLIILILVIKNKIDNYLRTFFGIICLVNEFLSIFYVLRMMPIIHFCFIAKFLVVSYSPHYFVYVSTCRLLLFTRKCLLLIDECQDSHGFSTIVYLYLFGNNNLLIFRAF